MPKLAVVYHSGYGHTKKVAELVKEGASIEGVESSIFAVEELTKDIHQLDAFDAIIFGSPTYMGSASAEMKTFMDAASSAWMKQSWRNKIAAGFTNGGGLSGDKLSTLMQFAIFAAQQHMIWIPSGITTSGSKNDKHGPGPEAVNRVGSYLGLMTQSDNAPVEETPSAGDIESAQLFGKNIAEATLRWCH